ncbi:hypothetical protein [Terrabacter sp. NPDC000476]|uniref:tetratricopeptide repeat protein n=1 Tax=Terrabacter sp. NPDC000476 TaxID=3154258 RepID=UPI003320E4AD
MAPATEPTSQGEAAEGRDPAAAVPREQVLATLDRILGSPSFRHAERSRAFLVYVVTETLAGRASRISERTVGRGALDRGPRFTGGNDASVRVRASRVRRALEEFYTGAGEGESMSITLPSGSYVPTFSWAPESSTPDVARELGLWVEPLAAVGEAAPLLAALATDALVRHLRQWSAVPVEEATGEGPNCSEVVAQPRWHVLSGSVVAYESSLRATVLLGDTGGATHWSRASDLSAGAGGLFEAVEAWSAVTAAAILDHDGALVRSWSQRQESPRDPPLRARVAWFRYLAEPIPERIEAAIADADGALASGEREPRLLSIRAALSTSRVLQRCSDDEVKDLAVAEELAREAIALDAGEAHAHFVLAGVARARGEWPLVLEHARTAAGLSRHSPASQFTAGALVAASGDWSVGVDRMTAVLSEHPHLPSNAHTWLALGHCVLGDYARALGAASVLGDDALPFGPLYRAIALSGLGFVDRAQDEAIRVLELRPEVAADAALNGLVARDVHVAARDLDRLVQLFADVVPPHVLGDH